MLVLTRKLDETIVINGDIRVTVVAIHANQIRLGFGNPVSGGSSARSCLTRSAGEVRAEPPVTHRLDGGCVNR